MKIDKSKLKVGSWYEDKDGKFIPSDDSASAPDRAETAHVCFPLEIRTEHFKLENHTDLDGFTRRTYNGSGNIGSICVHIGGGNEPVILAMANSGDYTLSEALAVYANCCERCANVLAYKYLNGADGYAEHSEEWEKCNTVCEFCEGEVFKDE